MANRGCGGPWLAGAVHDLDRILLQPVQPGPGALPGHSSRSPPPPYTAAYITGRASRPTPPLPDPPPWPGPATPNTIPLAGRLLMSLTAACPRMAVAHAQGNPPPNRPYNSLWAVSTVSPAARSFSHNLKCASGMCQGFASAYLCHCPCPFRT